LRFEHEISGIGRSGNRTILRYTTVQYIDFLKCLKKIQKRNIIIVILRIANDFAGEIAVLSAAILHSLNLIFMGFLIRKAAKSVWMVFRIISDCLLNFQNFNNVFNI